MKKRIITFLLTLVMIALFLPATLSAEPNGTQLDEGGGNLAEGEYFLGGNVTLKSPIIVTGNATIDLNGFVLEGNGSDSVIQITEGKTLTIKDSRPNEPHYFNYVADGAWTLNNKDHSGTSFAELGDNPAANTVVEVTGGCITGGTGFSENGNGGGVYVSPSGTLIMSGGNIIGNIATSKDGTGGGGGVFLAYANQKYASFTMSGGRIIGNAVTCGRGGGVFAGSYSEMTMSGGEIAYNYADDTNASEHGGGGVMTNGTFTMTGGSIHHNVIVSGEGGGVYRYPATNIRGGTTLGGNAQIRDNVKGDAIINKSNNTYSVEGGEVSNLYLKNASKVTLKYDSSKAYWIASDGSYWWNNNGWRRYQNNGWEPFPDPGWIKDGETKDYYLYLHTVTISSKTIPNNMSVGITLDGGSGQFTGLAEVTNTSCFFSDDPVYAIKHVTGSPNHLELAKSWTSLQNALNGSSTASINGWFDITDNTIKLQTDFKASTGDKTLAVSGTKTLDLNGHVVDADKISTVGSVITVNNGATLTLQDSGSTQTHTGNYASLPTGGCITGGNATQGGGINVPNWNGSYAYFYMKGGNIVGNTATSPGGGGVYVGTYQNFNMTGGSITGNKATNGRGGGVFAATSSKITMTDGEIAYNYADDTNASEHGGGGVMTNGTFTMTGGSIHDNVVKFGEGGGVYRYNSSTGPLTLGGGAEIKDNIKGVEASKDGYKYIATDGTKSNLYMAGTTFITLGAGNDEPTTMKVGIARVGGTGTFTGTASTADTQWFTSDNPSYVVKHVKDHLELVSDPSFSMTLMLRGKIGINFNVVTANPSHYYVEWTFMGKKDVANVSSFTKAENENKYSKVLVEAAAAEMTKNLHIEVFYTSVPNATANGEKMSEGYDYSVRQYAVNTIDKSNDAKLKTLCRIMLDYGAFAQEYFNVDTGNLANADGYGSGMNFASLAVPAPTYSSSTTELLPGISKVSKTLSLQSATTVNFLITLADDADIGDYTFKYKIGNGESKTAKATQQTDGRYRVCVENIASAELGWKTELEISNGEKTTIVTYNPMAYAYSVYTNSSDDKLKNVCKALYQYNIDSKTYFNVTD